MSNFSIISKCRVCYSKDLSTIGTLGDIAISTFTKQPETGQKCPLEVIECKKCTLIQLRHNAPQELMYSGHYWYKSGMNEVIKSDLKDIALTAVKEVNMKMGDVFLDIGANDGTLLGFVPNKFIRVGIEPATNLFNELSKHCEIPIRNFWENVDSLDPKPKVITAIGMFYDSEDPNIFMSKIKENLHYNGVFIAQLMTLEPMLQYNDVGNICHEHLEYYTYQSLVKLFEQNGLEIYKVKKNKINGGSYRLFARHQRNASVWLKESNDIKKFWSSLEKNKKKLVDFVVKKKMEGKSIYVYGASTKGNTILQYYGLNNSYIDGAADKDKEKWGKYTVATNIPIVSEEEARKKADYFWVMPWGFLDTFIQREQDFLARGGKFIVSTPKFEVYGIK